MRKTKIIARKN